MKVKISSLIISGMVASTFLYQNTILSEKLEQPMSEKKIELTKEQVALITMGSDTTNLVFKSHRRIKRNELTMIENRIAMMQQKVQIPMGGTMCNTLVGQRMARFSGHLIYGARSYQ